MNNYRNAFIATLIVAAALAAGLIYFWQESRNAKPMPMPEQTAAQPQQPAPAAPVAESAQPNLVPIQLSPQRMQSIGVTFAQVKRERVSDELRVTGSVDIDEQRLAYVQTRFPGWIQRVFVDATYQYVRKGQPLFTIYSQDLVSTEQEFLLALENRQALANSQSTTALQQADWLVEAARQRLRQWNVPDKEIAKIESSRQVQREITVESPASGYVTERNALPNQFVQPEMKLYTLADLSQVWVYAHVFQTDLGRVKPGDPATITVDAYPGRSFHGRVHQILPQVDPNTRTVRVRLIFSNPGLLLKPGMYVNVNLSAPAGTQLIVPASAVLQSGMRQVVFLDHGNGNLEPREIESGASSSKGIAVLKGLHEGDRIVSSANFLIDSESQIQAATGQFSPPQSAGGESAAQPSSVPSAAVDFFSDPSPPQRGNNTFRVKLTGASGQPITGAQVTVTFFMAAMPAMSMPAMRLSFPMADKGNGLYEGSGRLESGGTWQVTITAQQNGQTIATKQMNVSAAGGMQ